MKNALFAFAGLVLSLSLFAQGPQKSLYYYQKTEITPEEKRDVRVAIHKHIFIPLLEAAFSEDGSVQVASLEIQDIPTSPIGSSSDAAHYDFPLGIQLLIGENSYNITCSASLYNGVVLDQYESLRISDCVAEEGLLEFAKTEILNLNHNYDDYSYEYHTIQQPIVEITERKFSCISVVIVTKEGCPSYSKGEVTNYVAAYYQHRRRPKKGNRESLDVAPIAPADLKQGGGDLP